MEWSRKKDNFLNILSTRLRSLSSNRIKNKKSYLSFDSHIRIPIILNRINVTQASTQTLPININNNAEDLKSNVTVRHKNRRRKYQHRFNKCLVELLEKYPPIPAHEYLKEDKSINDDSKKSCYSSISNSCEINSSVWSKLLESREDLSKLNKTLEDLDQRLKRLSINICVKCKDKDFC
ncbi:unnamed protein product [Rotaria sordida]|uniref:Uncharacterized protein n=1 Tax=Rotaria sordida TaxID=392033 RepID=A0A819KMH5_9BILA|nr:unnamed protein product [Rotaria sordida]CAF0897978.1 unnamed protein product [Rotaria sordida]CAF0908956.1 unnamed protein product [Rotaria sordida]CAF0948865.1 unnamed protein product [Rotaria sordida]CAF0949207.1 unnamed protein product [Rotaria sordida]